MKTLYIHMGTHKTGSSVMQVLFARNSNNLWAENLYYPKRETNEAAKEAKITSGNAVELAHFMAARPNECNTLALFKSDMKQAGHRNLLYSSETFNAFNKDRAESFIGLAHQFRYTIQCIFFVRSPVGYAISQYSQLVKRHAYKHEFERYIDKGLVLPFSSISDAINIFGKANVRVENYDAHRGELQEFFLKEILALNPKKFKIAYEEVNRSLTQYELELMRICNTMENDKLISTYISDALIYGYDEPQDSQKISKVHLKNVREKCADDLKYINSLGVNPRVKMKDVSIRVGDENVLKFKPFERAMLSIFLQLVKDQVNSK